MAQATSVDAGTGNDLVDFNTVLLKSVNATLGAGDDHMSIEASTMGATTLAGGDGADTIGVDNLHASSLAVTGGNGNDNLDFNTVVVTNGTNIDAGANTDSVMLLHFTSNSLTVSLVPETTALGCKMFPSPQVRP